MVTFCLDAISCGFQVHVKTIEKVLLFAGMCGCIPFSLSTPLFMRTRTGSHGESGRVTGSHRCGGTMQGIVTVVTQCRYPLVRIVVMVVKVTAPVVVGMVSSSTVVGGGSGVTVDLPGILMTPRDVRVQVVGGIWGEGPAGTGLLAIIVVVVETRPVIEGCGCSGDCGG